MGSNQGIDRHSHTHLPDLIKDEGEKARVEAENGLRQADHMLAVIDSHVMDPPRSFRLRSSLLLELQQIAVERTTSFAGCYRPCPCEISQSKHRPPSQYLVPEYVEAMCHYVNQNWTESTAIHLAAYVLWRTNWIHPFADGNGRTARATAYCVLNIRLGYRIPGTSTIPDLISNNKTPYYSALEECDDLNDPLSQDANVKPMETLLEGLLSSQLTSIWSDATGKPIDSVE